MTTVRLGAARHYQDNAATKTLCGKTGATPDQFRHSPATCRACIRSAEARRRKALKV